MWGPGGQGKKVLQPGAGITWVQGGWGIRWDDSGHWIHLLSHLWKPHLPTGNDTQLSSKGPVRIMPPLTSDVPALMLISLTVTSGSSVMS